jgi:hypothetical protein
MKHLRLRLILGAVILAGWHARAQTPIPLKAHTVIPFGAAAPIREWRIPAPGHFLIQFRTDPPSGIRDLLERRGLRITASIAPRTLMVSARTSVNLSGLDVAWMGPYDAADKLSPQLAATLTSAYLVIFHRDADMQAARAVVESVGLDVIPNPNLLPNHLLVGGSYWQLLQLAEADSVAYILPASADLVSGASVEGCAGPVTEVGPVADYALGGTGWAKDDQGVVALQYYFVSVTNRIDEATVRSEFERAFREWERYAPIRLSLGQQPDATRTIAIQFARGAHGDNYPFDGPGGVLAHTFYPSPPNSETIAGDMHLDADEAWGVGSGVDLFSVALHETGHALGLAHSDMPGSVMYPYYRVTSGLTADDIAAIQALYGSGPAAPDPRGAVPPQTPALPPPGDPTVPIEPSGPALPPPEGPSVPAAPLPPSTPASPSPPAVPAPADRTPPALAIVIPASTIVSTSSALMTMSGTAADNVGVTSVQWSTSNGDSGRASGTAHWTAVIPLLVGTNVVTVRAYDAAGNSSWRAVTVVRY